VVILCPSKPGRGGREKEKEKKGEDGIHRFFPFQLCSGWGGRKEGRKERERKKRT